MQCVNQNYESQFKIAIIGGGASGVTFAYYLINYFVAQKSAEQAQITIFDPSPIGTGLAYQQDFDHLLLNVHAESMGVRDVQLDNFFDWYKKRAKGNDRLASIVIDENFPPRHVFGMYLSELFEESKKIANQHKIFLHHIKEEIIDLDRKKCGYQLTTSSHKKWDYDFVMLCVGHTKTVDIYNLKEHEGYIHHPYPLRKTLIDIPPKDKVAILGSGLTAIDVAISLIENKHEANIHFHSRSGDFPSVRGKNIPHQLQFLNEATLNNLMMKNNGYIKLKDILKLLRKEFSYVGEYWKNIFSIKFSPETFQEFLTNEIVQSNNQIKWQSILIATNSFIEDCWNALRHEDKKLFLDKYHSVWMTKRSPIPPINAKKILAFLDSGQLAMKKGINDIDKINDHFRIRSSNNEYNHYKWVINATGPSRHLDINSSSSLMKNLLRKGYVKNHFFGGIDVDFKTGSIIDKSNCIDFCFRAIGHITLGTYYYTSSYPMISRKAKQIAEEIIGFLKSRFKDIA